MSSFEAVIGLEVHVQLATDSKIFCSCRAKLEDGRSVADEAPNANTCPICAGHPGTLPVLNKKVVEMAVQAGLGTGCKIRGRSVFSRKNYFYADLPKGYQITQFDEPICEDGELAIETSAGSKRVRIKRIHIEEDAGKSVHGHGQSLVNLNRAGVPLVEIVSEPDMRTAEEAGAYLRALHAIVTYLGICDGNMEEGNFRCDANVSVRLRGAKEFGTRCEIKNVNSFRFVEKAIEFEIARQIGIVQSGGKVIQETRGYDSAKNHTVAMRSKEEAHDYRYFPDPDLLPLAIDAAWVEKLRAALPELPAQRRERYSKELGLGAQDAGVLTSTRSLAEFFEAVVSVLVQRGRKATAVGKAAANLVLSEASRTGSLKPEQMADVVGLVLDNVVSSTGAKTALTRVIETGDSVASIVEREGLKQVSDLSALEPAIDEVIAANPAQVAEYRAGKEKLLTFFVGQTMKKTGGKANPALLQELIKKKLQA